MCGKAGVLPLAFAGFAARISLGGVALALLTASAPGSLAEGGSPKFRASRIEGHGSGRVYCDLDGDRLQDIVLLERTNLAIFFQEPGHGFRKEPDQRQRLSQPTLVCPARRALGADRLFLIDSDGAAELRVASAGDPVVDRIIRQKTVIPPKLDGLPWLALGSPLAVGTGSEEPLVLVPAGEDLQVWRQRDAVGWQLTQTVGMALDVRLSPWLGREPGYSTWVGLGPGVSDLNNDGREDLIVRRHTAAGMTLYALYWQRADGSFGSKPDLTYETKPGWRSWLGWLDLNRDGKLDLIKTTWLYEPWFVPGVRSGKVLVGIHLATEQGELPTEPQQMFRKNDWTPAVPIVDIDGDGYVDLALGYSLFDSREGVRKMITARQLDFSLKFHFYRPGEGFAREPDCQHQMVIHLDRHSLHLGAERSEYFERFIDLTGDFNGDRKRDLLVRDHSDKVSVYLFLSREEGFSRRPSLRLDCPEPIERLQTQDLNNDGVSDLVVELQNRNGFRVFLSANN